MNDPTSPTQARSVAPGKRRKFTPEQAVAAVRRCIGVMIDDEDAKPPVLFTVADYRRLRSPDEPSVGQLMRAEIQRQFDGEPELKQLQALVRLADSRATTSRKGKFSREQCIAGLKQLYPLARGLYDGLTEDVYVQLHKSFPHLPPRMAVLNEFDGSWEGALNAAALPLSDRQQAAVRGQQRRVRKTALAGV